jgi:hypothetical protein
MIFQASFRKPPGRNLAARPGQILPTSTPAAADLTRQILRIARNARAGGTERIIEDR